MTDLALLYEHPAWFTSLFAALERRGIDFVALEPDGHFDPADTTAPAPIVFNRVAMSSFLRARTPHLPLGGLARSLAPRRRADRQRA